MKRLLIGLALFLVCAGLAAAQEYRGNVYATVLDQSKKPVVGATCSLAGRDFTRNMISDSKGECRFIRLEPGLYSLQVTFPDFQPASFKTVEVSINSNVQLVVNMAKALTEEVTVTAATPLLDPRKVGTGAVMTTSELTQLPQVRDPWAILTTVPGVSTDRLNIGGSESGQQSNIAGKGDAGFNTVWVLDGMNVTDNASAGGSTGYYDFSSFAEMAVQTGGTDFEQTTPGVVISFVSKQGTNKFGGSMRMVRATSGMQSDNMPDAAKQQNDYLVATYGASAVSSQPIANRIDETFEKGFDFSGPIVEDSAWFWFGFDKNDIDIVKKGKRDSTTLTNWGVKFHGSLFGAKTAWRAFYQQAQKTKIGRTGGLDSYALQAQADTLWNQAGPNKFYDFDVSHFFTPNFQLSLQVTDTKSEFGLVPPATGDAVIDVNSVLWNGNIVNTTKRPVKTATLRGTNFFSTGAWDHELKYGYRYKDAGLESLSKYSATGAFGYVEGQSEGVPYGYLYLGADAYTKNSLKEDTLWIGDTITRGPLTVIAGLTYVRSRWNWDPFVAPDLVYQGYTIKGVSFPGYDPGVRWKNLLPRVGVTYTLPGERRTLLRGSYSKFADPATMDLSLGSFGYPGNTVGSGSHVMVFPWGDQGCEGFPQYANDHLVEPCEWQSAPGKASATSEFFQVNKQDKNLSAPTVDEFILGAEHEFLPDFTVGAALTYRERRNDYWTPYAGISANQMTVLKGGTSASDPLCFPYQGREVCGSFWGPDAAAAPDYYLTSPAGLPLPPPRILTNHPDYSEKYKYLELTATKRLSNKWMARGYITFGGGERQVGARGVIDPTLTGPDTYRDGGVPGSSAGARSGSFRYSYPGTNKWALNINGLYQLPRDWTVSGNLFARDGYVEPIIRRTTVFYPNGYPTTGTWQLGNADDFRASTLRDIDLKISKLFRLGTTTFELGFEGFNVLNENTTLQHNLRVGKDYTGFIYEYMSPRVFRFNAVVTF